MCSNEYSKIAEFEFEECVFFGDDNTRGFGTYKEPEDKTYICYDWIAINKGGKIDQDYIEVGDDFVNHIWLYSSDRIDGNTGVKDACLVSYMKESQLLDFGYSETMARFKMIDEMKKRGIKGPHAGGYTSAGNPKHYKMKATHMSREIYPNYKKTLIASPQITMADFAEETLLQQFREVAQTNTTFMRFYNAFGRDNTGS